MDRSAKTALRDRALKRVSLPLPLSALALAETLNADRSSHGNMLFLSGRWIGQIARGTKYPRAVNLTSIAPFVSVPLHVSRCSLFGAVYSFYFGHEYV